MSAQQSSMNDVFRFVKVRPIKIDVTPVRLLDSHYSVTLANTSNVEKRRLIANHALLSDPNRVVASPGSLYHGNQIDNALRSALDIPHATLQHVLEALEDSDDIATRPTFASDRERLSDTLLLARYASTGIPLELPVLRRLYLVYHFISLVSTDASVLGVSLASILSHILMSFFDRDDEHARRRITSVGIADLLVVKQHIMRYEATEIAHVENIMSGETRRREHRTFERIEETVTIEHEKVKEQEKELQTEERFELNQEASKTVKEDQKYAFDLSVSAKYGPTVEVESSFGLDVDTSTESASKSASVYAKDVLERSLERVTDRVREERVRTIRRETEEKNFHEFTNGDGQPHKVGIYQFLDKIYEAQVFNYGKRQLFDLIVPEPASYLWYLSQHTESESRTALPVPPEPLTIAANDILFLDAEGGLPNHYLRLAQKYGATGLTPPPERFKIATAKFQNPSSGSAYASESGEIMTAPVTLEIPIQEGYRVLKAVFYSIAFSDNGTYVRIPFSIGGQGETWGQEEGDAWDGRQVHSHGNYSIRTGSVTLDFTTPPAIPPVLSTANKLVVTALPYETANYTISVEVHCEATDSLITAWKITTHEHLREVYASRLLEYKDELSKVELEQRQKQQNENVDVGLPPSKRKQLIFTELKKHCIAMFMGNWFDGTEVSMTGLPPMYGIDEAITKGNRVRFLEQAIEWSQLQYAFYPYYWARKSTWEDRIQKDDADYEFQQFMQAGAARVVFPVRPGFEEAFCYFLEGGEPWKETGRPLSIDDPLYVTIVDELKELSGGALETPEPVGEPWEVRLPTNLVMLRRSSTLPAWEKTEGTVWDWQPVPEDAA
jgi:hypothetical protein